MRNKNISILLIGLLLLSIPVTAETSIKLAAVDQENKGIVLDMTVEVEKGKGRVLLSAVPFTGIAAQHAQYEAVKIAENITGTELSEKDVIFTFKGTADKIDGESAGGAMAAAVIAEIEGRKIREDVVFSGTIDSKGKIGEIGAVLPKIYAAAKVNATLFLVPETQIKEIIVIEKVEGENGLPVKTTKWIEIDVKEYSKEHWGMDVRGIRNISEAMDVYYSENGKRKQWEEYLLEKRELLEEEKVLEKMAEERIESVEKWISETEKGTEQVEKKIGKAKKYLEMGYAYPAANKAFQAEIDMTTAKDLAWIRDNKGVEEIIEETRGKMRALEPDRRINPETMHWLVAAQERYTWAEILLDDIEKANMTDEKKVENLALVKAWVRIAEEFIEVAGEGDIALSSDIAKIAIREVAKAEKETDIASMLTDDRYGAELYLRAAKKELEKGWFIAAGYDAIYAEARAHASIGVGMPELEWEGREWALHYQNNAKIAASEGAEVEARAFARAGERIKEYDREIAELEKVIKKEEITEIEKIQTQTEEKETEGVLYLIGASILILLILPLTGLTKKR